VFTGNVVTFSISDAGLGDDDFALGVNGFIVDQGGPGVAAVLVPTLDVWALALLTLLVLGLGSRYVRRRN
jgi:hypothetical protein